LPFGNQGAIPFQFHTGSIKAPSRLNRPGIANMFQFHTGSIKAEKAANYILQKQGFNSTLVRLKHSVNDALKKAFIVSIPHWFD